MKKEIQKILENSVKEAYGSDLELPEIEVIRPKEEKFGDFTSNIAMVLAGKLKKNPMEIAEEIVELINGQIAEIEKVEVVKPGYVNFYLSEKYFQNKVEEIIQKEKKYGKQPNKGISINNEFISANPTGPLHIGNGRGGFYGDVLSKVLEKAGRKECN